MDSTVYFNFLRRIESLTTEQYKGLRNTLTKYDDKKRNAITLQKNKQGTCPHCQHNHIINWGVRSDLQRYKCKKCGKTFNQLTGTPLARLKKKGRWLEYSNCLKKGYSIRKAARICEIDKVTSFKWRHRFLENAIHIKPNSLKGIVELGEVYFKYSEKGKKLTSPCKTRRYRKPKICVLFARDRNKNTFDQILLKFNDEQLKTSISPIIDHDTLVCADSKSPYLNFTKEIGLRHGKLNLSKGVNVVKDIVHVQNVTMYSENLKEWMKRFRGVATKYLNSYLSWYRELDEFNMKIDKVVLMLRAKNGTIYFHQP